MLQMSHIILNIHSKFKYNTVFISYHFTKNPYILNVNIENYRHIKDIQKCSMDFDV
jgi:hypothetical protein